MIGSGFKKLAQKYGLAVAGGVAYGSLKGYASTLSEGSGYKQIKISTKFIEAGQDDQLLTAVNAANISRTYRVQTFTVYPDWINIVFQDTVGTIKKIEEFIEWFYPLLDQYGATGANVCMECGGEVAAGGWYLIGGIAEHMHESCAQKTEEKIRQEEQEQRDSDTGSYIQGLIGAMLGALLGAIVWAIVLFMGYVASIVGLLIGWLANKGYTLMHGKQGKGKIAILIVAIIFGVLLGTIIPDVVTLVQMIGNNELIGVTYGDIPALIVLTFSEDAQYRGAVIGNVGIGILFAGLGVFALLAKAKQEVSSVKIKKLN